MKRDFKDFSADVRPHQSKALRWLLIAVGWISFALGIVGIFLPVLPTTPFLLLSALCFAKSSARFYNWLLNHRWFGPYILNWKKNGTIPFKTKIIALTLLTISLGSSIAFFVRPIPLKIMLATIGIAVAVYLIRIPTAKN